MYKEKDREVIYANISIANLKHFKRYSSVVKLLDYFKQQKRPFMMRMVTFYLGSMLACSVACLKIGVISNATFISYDNNTATIHVNGSCVVCGCIAKQQNYSAFNCFTNNGTCTMFPMYPTKYGLNTTTNGIFYFFELPTIGRG